MTSVFKMSLSDVVLTADMTGVAKVVQGMDTPPDAGTSNDGAPSVCSSCFCRNDNIALLGM